jgi:hypothetical protein
VQTCIVAGVPLTIALIFFKFGAHFLLDLRFEWLACNPDITPLLQISHLLDTKNTSLEIVKKKSSQSKHLLFYHIRYIFCKENIKIFQVYKLQV